MTNYRPAIPTATWALVRDAKVVDLAWGPSTGTHPFDASERVIDVTGADCTLGYVVDDKGNVAPASKNGDVLGDGEPAYLEKDHVPARPSGVIAHQLVATSPHPLERTLT